MATRTVKPLWRTNWLARTNGIAPIQDEPCLPVDRSPAVPSRPDPIPLLQHAKQQHSATAWLSRRYCAVGRGSLSNCLLSDFRGTYWAPYREEKSVGFSFSIFGIQTAYRTRRARCWCPVEGIPLYSAENCTGTLSRLHFLECPLECSTKSLTRLFVVFLEFLISVLFPFLIFVYARRFLASTVLILRCVIKLKLWYQKLNRLKTQFYIYLYSNSQIFFSEELSCKTLIVRFRLIKYVAMKVIDKSCLTVVM